MVVQSYCLSTLEPDTEGSRKFIATMVYTVKSSQKAKKKKETWKKGKEKERKKATRKSWITKSAV